MAVVVIELPMVAIRKYQKTTILDTASHQSSIQSMVFDWQGMTSY